MAKPRPAKAQSSAEPPREKQSPQQTASRTSHQIAKSSTIAPPAPLREQRGDLSFAQGLWWWPLVPITLVYAFDLGGHGFSSLDELPIVFRAEAFWGIAHSQLESSPWFPDALRQWMLAGVADHRLDHQNGSHILLRLPGLVAALLLVYLGGVWARIKAATPGSIAATMLLVAAMPSTIATARTLSFEGWASVGIALCCIGAIKAHTLSPPRLRRALLWWLISAIGWALATHSAGLWMGGTLALALITAWLSSHGRSALAFGLSAGVLAMITAGLVLGQGEGYQPWLASAQVLGLESLVLPRRLFLVWSGVVPQWGMYFVPVMLALLWRDRKSEVEAAWLLLFILFASLWQLSYPAPEVSAAIPSAWLLVHSFRAQDRDAPRRWRILLLLLLVQFWLFGKQLGSSDLYFVWPGLADTIESGNHFDPEARAQVRSALRIEYGLGFIAAALLGLGLGAPALRRVFRGQAQTNRPSEGQKSSSKKSEASAFNNRVHGLVLAVLGAAMIFRAHEVHDLFAQQRSPRSLAHFVRTLRSKHPEAEGRCYGPEDPGLAVYFRNLGGCPELSTRSQIGPWLGKPSPRWLLTDRLSYPSFSRRLFDLPTSVAEYAKLHPSLTLLVNQRDPSQSLRAKTHLPSPSPSPPLELAHSTQIRFGQKLELIGWEWEKKPRRGSSARLKLAFRVLGSVPTRARFTARLQKGRISRANAKTIEFGNQVFPPSQWRVGDVIVETCEFPLSWVLNLPGEHELIVGVQKNRSSRYPITLPKEDTPLAENQRWVGKKREFIAIDRIEVE